jgi:glycosyltransferase involved in cell wall biosynthesis
MVDLQIHEVTQASEHDAFSAAPASPSGRLRVAFCITDLDVGGAESALAELVRRLPTERFESRVYSLMAEPADHTRSLACALRAAGVPVATLGARGVRDAPRSTRRLAREWRLWRPDIVQTFLWHANILGRLAARWAGVPHVVSGIRVAERRGGWRLWLDRATDRLVERHVCVSQSVADFSRSFGRLPPDKLLVIPNGIDISKYDSATPTPATDLGVPPGRRVIACVGRLDAQKGLDWLLREAPNWLAPLGAHDLVIVGEGPERGALEEIVHRQNLQKRVHFAGWRSDVPGILAASDLLVLPSRWEGMPNVVLEAMASRRPVLASDVEGVRELLGDDAALQVAAAGNAEDWHKKLSVLASDRQLASLLGERNRRRVEGHFTLSRVTEAYAALYTSLVHSAGTAPR